NTTVESEKEENEKQEVFKQIIKFLDEQEREFRQGNTTVESEKEENEKQEVFNQLIKFLDEQKKELSGCCHREKQKLLRKTKQDTYENLKRSYELLSLSRLTGSKEVNVNMPLDLFYKMQLFVKKNSKKGFTRSKWLRGLIRTAIEGPSSK
ncbi:MAG: hypothetical protein RR733_05345, partial [Victivallaceae bacterium]